MEVVAEHAPTDIRSVSEIMVYGAKRTGIYTVVVMALRHPNIVFTICDPDVVVINSWMAGQNLYPKEPQFALMLAQAQAGKLHYEINLAHVIHRVNVIILALEFEEAKPSRSPKGDIKLADWDLSLRRLNRAAQFWPKVHN
ncbi:hypothetical protein RHGRI_033664 [Rhododendron griersonianum]|uniref:Uncharacterized protein n=1 Tax=Rhododendron griersonianum TaxID=479676 RepID=A0AAV6HY90_9ERIC|nr:hypothetical protein RHGRI_033664 [Rhododendron griersonianum]